MTAQLRLREAEFEYDGVERGWLASATSDPRAEALIHLNNYARLERACSMLEFLSAR